MALSKRYSARLAGLALTAAILSATSAYAAQPLVSTGWLKQRLGQEDLVILDVRTKMADSGKEDYLKAHVPGAVWSDYPGFWRTDRGDVVGVLPSTEKLEASLSELGISDRKHVVIYPAGTSASDFGIAARLYWTLKYLGHEEVSILDGGWKAWSGDPENPVESGEVKPVGDLFIADIQDGYNISTEEVSASLGSEALLVDARPDTQYLGKEKHPKATRFGRLPGAIQADNHGFFDAQAGKLKSREELATLLPASVKPDSEIISYCNTGHWAATNWFVMHEVLGYQDVRMYDESMVGWSQTAYDMDSDRTRLDDIKDWFNGLLGS